MSGITDFELAQRIHVATHQLKGRIAELESDLAACRAEAKSAFDLSVECRARAVKAEARYNVERNGCRVDQFGLWAIIPDDPHGLESIKRDFDADVDQRVISLIVRGETYRWT